MEACLAGSVVGLGETVDACPRSHGVSVLHQGGSSLEAIPIIQATLNRPEPEVGNFGTWKGSSEGGDSDDKMEFEEGSSVATPLF